MRRSITSLALALAFVSCDSESRSRSPSPTSSPPTSLLEVLESKSTILNRLTKAANSYGSGSLTKERFLVEFRNAVDAIESINSTLPNILANSSKEELGQPTVSAALQSFMLSLNQFKVSHSELQAAGKMNSEIHTAYASVERALKETPAEQGVASQSATRSESDSEGGDKPQPESEERSR